MPKKKQRKQRSIMYTQQMRLACLTDWKDEVARIVEVTQPLHWAGILHDKDLNDEGEPVEPHIHLMMYFKHARSPQSVAWDIIERKGKREDAPTERLEFFRRPNNGYSYLVHQTSDAQDKYQYPLTDVISNFDFEKKIKSIQKQVDRAEKGKENDLISEYLDLLYEGEITLEEIENELTGSQYARASHRLKAVAEKRQERLAKDFIARMKSQGRVKQVIYIYGQSGLGKTRLARTYAETEGKPYYLTGSSRDPFQGYRNQDTVIIDELRPETFRYDDLLKILDPFNFDVFLPSRYVDKALTADLLFVTSPYSPRQLYNHFLNLKSIDSFDQLERRIGTTILVEVDTIFHMSYNDQTEEYEEIENEQFPNPFYLIVKEKHTSSFFQQLEQTINRTKGDVSDDNTD